MKAEVRKEDASVRVVGREFIILIVVIFSSLSFTLGFFVGKNSTGKEPGPSFATVPQTHSVENPLSATADQPQTPVPDGSARDVARPPNEQQTTTIQPASYSPEHSYNENGRDAESGDAATGIAGKERHESGKAKGNFSAKKSGVIVLYTVQLGALRNAAEARGLMTAYEKKGYKTYITTFRNSDNEKIYKVRAGEFSEKKEAEILALKIKKSEGLAAFVTVKND